MIISKIKRCLAGIPRFWDYEKKMLYIYLSSDNFFAEKYFQDITLELKQVDKRLKSIEKNSKGEVVLIYKIKLKKGEDYKREAKKIVKKLMGSIQGKGSIIHWDDKGG